MSFPPVAAGWRPSLLARALFAVNAVATATAAIVLFCDPQRITRPVGLKLAEEPTVLSDLLGASELGMAALCIFAARSRQPATVRAACWTLVVFHFASALAGLRAYAEGTLSAVLLNVAARVVMVVLFAWLAYGLRDASAAPIAA